MGRTKTSNFLQRCNKQTRLFFCWQHFWQPAALIALLIEFGAGLAQLSGFSIRDFVGLGSQTTPTSDIKVYFSAREAKSDFELKRGGRTFLFVRIPLIREPVNRLVFGTAILRPVNTGSRSLSGIQLTTTFDDKLWNSRLNIFDRESFVSLVGVHEFKDVISRVNDRWVASRTLPRLDPMTGIPYPISFLLQFHAATPEKDFNLDAEGKLEINMFGTDWIGLMHILEIRCIPADTAEEFFALSRSMASTLRSKGYPNVPVLFADTGGQSIVSVESGPTIIQASIKSIIGFAEQPMLYDLN